jgi:outer membrane protein TolC
MQSRSLSRLITSLLLATTSVGAVSSAHAALWDPFQTDSVIAKAAPEYRPHAGVGCELPNAALTLPQAIDLALCRNPTTRAAWAAAQVQAASLGVAEGSYLPSITLSGNDNRLSGDLQAGSLTRTEQDGKSAVAALSWTLVDFNARSSEVATARNSLLAAAHTASETAQRTVYSVVQAYYGAIATEQAYHANQQTESNTARSLEIARALQTGGAATLADVMQAETAYQQAVYSRLQSNTAAQTSRANLAVLLGFPADQAITLAPVTTPAAPAITARVSELLALAARQRPDLAAARDQRAAAESAVTSAKAVGRPKISLGAQHTINEINALPRQNYNSIGLQISVPVFSGLQTHYGIRRAEATLEEITAQSEQTRLSVSLDVWNAFHTLDAANQELATSATLAKAAATNEEIAIGRYQSGVGSMLDVLTAQSAGANARIIRIQSEFNWQAARAQLALAVGRLTSAADLDAVAPVSAP